MLATLYLDKPNHANLLCIAPIQTDVTEVNTASMLITCHAHRRPPPLLVSFWSPLMCGMHDLLYA